MERFGGFAFVVYFWKRLGFLFLILYKNGNGKRFSFIYFLFNAILVFRGIHSYEKRSMADVYLFFLKTFLEIRFLASSCFLFL